MIVYEKDGVIGRRVSLRDNIEYIRIEMPENAEIEKHVLDIDVDFYILDGIGEIMLNSKSIKVKKDDFVAVEKGSSRGAISSSAMSFLVIKHLNS